MILKIIFLVVLSYTVHAIDAPPCCTGSNVLGRNQTCSDGTGMKSLDCHSQYFLSVNDKLTNITIDLTGNIVFDGIEKIPPSQYCKTLLKSKNEEGYIVCAINVEDELIDTTRNMYTVFELFSATLIIITVVIYLTILETLNLQDVCILHSISGMAGSFITLSIINLTTTEIPEGFCHFLSYLLYFCFMYCFFWLNVLCFNIWKDVVQPRCLKVVNNWTLIYHIYGIGAPMLAVCWVVINQYGNIEALSDIFPGIGWSRCWFRTVREVNIYFAAPVGILLLINSGYFIWTTLELWNYSKNCPKTKILKYRLRMYVKLFFVMGITWIFEVLSTLLEEQTPTWIWIITDALNSLLGLIIFLILVVFRKKIKRALANRRICKWRLPVQWKNEKDSECEELEEDVSFGSTDINLDNEEVKNKLNIYN